MLSYSNFRVHFCLAVALISANAASPVGAVQTDQRPKPDRPNILWITSEDNSSFWLGSYGNHHAATPNLDKLSRSGIQFQNAYSNAAVCAVARSTLLLGVHAVTTGTHHMRSRYPIEQSFVPYVTHLRQAGYFCTNNAKTDFNFRGDDQAIWDQCSRQAHYRQRPGEKPFFAVFNIECTHESNLFPEKIETNREKGLILRSPRVAPDEVNVPPFLPHCIEVRRDMAVYHDLMTAMDSRVGEILQELQKQGLADNTIVFYFSDHGGPTPRGKRYLEDPGVKIPLIVHIPDRWKDLSPWQAGTQVDEQVSFVDFAPSLLSLIGIEIPPVMQGRAFLGAQRSEPAADSMVYLYADRFDELPGMRRGLTDGRYKYIRRFFPDQPAAPYADYPMGMQSWVVWKKLAEEGKLGGYHHQLWSNQQAPEELYDLRQDAYEMNNLAGVAEHLETLGRFRFRLLELAVRYQDLGVIPESEFQSIAGDQPLSRRLRETDFDWQSAWEDLHMRPLEQAPRSLTR
jgi:N-sulfoglucosamine sulfohydrolase